MDISVIDGSSYFKGLLLLIRKDKKITKDERDLIARIGGILGFEKMFIENAINEILDNRYISTVPPVFSSKELAEKFLKDGLTIAASDREIHRREEDWLYSVADSNSIKIEWLEREKNSILNNSSRHLEVENIKVRYC